MLRITAVMAGFTAFLVSTTAMANKMAPDEEGLSVQVSGGVILFDSGNSLNPSSSKARISSLESAADKELSTVPLLALNISYKPDPEGIRYLFTTRPPVEEAGGLAFAIGAEKKFAGLAISEVGLFTAPFGEVWENPYLINEDRQETDNEQYGAYVRLKRVMETPLQVTAYYLSDNVEDDLIALIEQELARDGELYGVNSSYMIPLAGPRFALLPKVSFSYGDYEGGANTYIQYSFGLGARYSSGKITFLPEISFGRTEYDELDPQFGVARSEDTFSARLMVRYDEPFDLANVAVSSFFGVSEGDSNIAFYDTESFSAGFSLSYTF